MLILLFYGPHCIFIIIIISSLPHGRSLASMSSIYLYLQPFFSFLRNCLPSNRKSYPSLASFLVSFLSFFPLSSALTNCSLVQHVLSSSFSASLLFAPNISLPRPRPALLHSSSYPANSPSLFFSTPTSQKRSAYPLLPFLLSTFRNHTTLPTTPTSRPSVSSNPSSNLLSK